MKQLLITLLSLFLGLNLLFSQVQPNPCLANESFRIVVIGSSTAAGTGASTPANAWVNRYRTFLDSINPANEVINLAQGGYNTYRLMPTSFVPPTNRPLPDTARNITQALSLNPDAVIINLPSNDAASGYGTVEQMSNFIAMHTAGLNQNVPVWVCTTQPRNFGASAIQVQVEVRDSVLVQFGSFALDFWSGTATTGNTIDPNFDSGDGVHLNDAGHGILFEVVRQANLPGNLLDTAAYSGPNLSINQLHVLNPSVCGDSQTIYQIIVANQGSGTSNNLPIRLQLLDQNNSNVLTFNDTLVGGLATCSLDTIEVLVNTFAGGDLEATAFLIQPGDTTPGNDSLWRFDRYSGHPMLQSSNVWACAGDSFLLNANTSLQDTIVWYDSLVGGSIIGFGSNLGLPPGSNTVNAYAAAVRGNLYYSNIASTTWNSNINWNGCMFDLVAQDSLIVDSLSLKVNTLGNQAIEWYYKNGSYSGFEGNSSAWTLGGIETVNVIDPDVPVTISTISLSLLQGDTMGIYLQLANPSSNLSYLSNGSSGTWGTSELSILTGAGISHNFSSSFSPRNWNGEVHYHFGFNPDGDCTTERQLVQGQVAPVLAQLGADTVVCPGSPIILNAGTGNSYLWSDGTTSNTLQITTTGLYSVTVTEPLANCTAVDTVQISAVPAPTAVLPLQTVQCGGPVLLDAGNPGMSFLWSTNHTGQVLSAVTSGQYTVTVTNLCATLMDTIMVQIDSLPQAELVGDTALCDSLLLQVGNYPGASYLWSTGNTGMSQLVTQTGNYWVEISNSCGNSIDASFITVESIPTAGFSVQSNGAIVGFSDQSLQATQWQWDFGDGNSSTQNSPIHSYSSNGSYTITLIASNSCGSDTVTQNLEVSITGIDEWERTGIRLYPNPVSHQFQITGHTSNLPVHLEIRSSDGRLVWQRNNLQLPQTFNRPILAQGTYFYRLYNNEEVVAIGRLVLLP